MAKKSLTTITKTPQTRLAFCENVITREKGIGTDILAIAGDLMLIRDNRLYEGQWETFNEYLAEFRNIAESTASRLITIYEVFVLKYKIPPKKLAEARGWTLLYSVVGNVNSKAQAVEWLEKATELSRNDLKKEITEEHTGVQQKDCKHEESFFIWGCPTCGIRERVSEMPKDALPRKVYDLGTLMGERLVLVTDDPKTAASAKDFMHLLSQERSNRLPDGARAELKV